MQGQKKKGDRGKVTKEGVVGSLREKQRWPTPTKEKRASNEWKTREGLPQGWGGKGRTQGLVPEDGKGSEGRIAAQGKSRTLHKPGGCLEWE